MSGGGFIRFRSAALFGLGFLAGAFCFYGLLWRTGGLARGHFLSKTTADFVSAARRVTPVPAPVIRRRTAGAFSPLPTMTATPTPLPPEVKPTSSVQTR